MSFERLPRCPVCYRKPARKPRILRAVFYLHFTNEGGKPKERPQAAFASGATLSTGSSNQAGHRLELKGTPPRRATSVQNVPRDAAIRSDSLNWRALRINENKATVGSPYSSSRITVWPEHLLSLEDVGYCQQSCLDF